MTDSLVELIPDKYTGLPVVLVNKILKYTQMFSDAYAKEQRLRIIHSMHSYGEYNILLYELKKMMLIWKIKNIRKCDAKSFYEFYFHK